MADEPRSQQAFHVPSWLCSIVQSRGVGHTLVMLASQPALMTATGTPPSLDNGTLLPQAELPRPYEAMAGLQKAELIEGVVHLPSPVNYHHARPGGIMHRQLGAYAGRHGLEVLPNLILLLDADNVPPPDAVLCTPLRNGGRVWLSDKHYLCGAPELVVEIAASTVSFVLRGKLRVYRRNGMSEYFVWRVQDTQIDWFILEKSQYAAFTPDTNGRLQSRVFPGQILDVQTELGHDRQAGLAALGL